MELDSWLNSVQKLDFVIITLIINILSTVMSLSDRSDGPLQTARNDVKEHFRLLREKLERYRIILMIIVYEYVSDATRNLLLL